MGGGGGYTIWAGGFNIMFNNQYITAFSCLVPPINAKTIEESHYRTANQTVPLYIHQPCSNKTV